MGEDPQIPLLDPAELQVLRQQLAAGAGSWVADLPWLGTLDCGAATSAAPASEWTVAVFNAERGSRFDGIRALLDRHPVLTGADVLLLNEIDWGMARSGNRHVARDLAAALGLGYVFGIEFLELTNGEGAELDSDGENTWSLHGNAILSRWALRDPRLLRLPARYSWAEGPQARMGGRCALMAEVDTVAGPVTLVCTHLENRTSPQGRQEQMRALLAALPKDGRAIVGGDLNTSTIDSAAEIVALVESLRADPLRLREPESYEPLFADVRHEGFLIEEVNSMATPTSVPLGISDPIYGLKLDWLFARGVDPSGTAHPQVVTAQWNGSRVSDHDFVVARLLVGSAEGKIVP
jgi:endonuclease/exonuclease/phosphatase family metal-dependent hydrolase